MWILDADGDSLKGKRVWLRPGKKYLFGRTGHGAHRTIEHSSVSRKHMVIEVSSVKPGDGRHIHTKSEITVTDLGTKSGTVVDGEQIKGDSRKLDGEQHTIMLGRYAKSMRVKWQPVVFSFSFSNKELKAGDPLAHVCSRVEDLDVKTVMPYIVDQTTHVVQTKRNTAKGLQALINGRYIVQDSYLDALVYAATPRDLENLESLSPLESDFDSSWPDPTDHLPPPGKEPIPRPAEAFSPNPARINVFEGYTFVFGDASQFETLCGPINNGHGKALLYEIKSGVTTAEDVVQFMRNAADGKGLGSERSTPGGAILVRFREKGPWEINLGEEIAQLSDQRIIEQSEFLDAILENDASPLCRQLPRELTPSQEPEAAAVPATPGPEPITNEISQVSRSSPPPVPASQPETSQAKRSQAESSLPTNTRRKRPVRTRTFVSKVQNFDDGFDMDSLPTYPAGTPDMPPPPPISPGPMDAEPQTQRVQETQLFTQVEEEKQQQEAEDVVSDLLPGAEAMKRRRTEMVQRQGEGAPMAGEKQEESPRPKRQKLDVMEAARKRRNEEEYAQRQRREEEEVKLQEALKDMNVDEMKNLAIVEEVPLPVREPRGQKVTKDGDDDRWDERWNGRKNFKKFRRKGDPTSAAPRHRVQRVMVALEEVKRKDFGIGDHYWVGSNETSQNNNNNNNNSNNSQREPLASQEDVSGTGIGNGTGRGSSSQRSTTTATTRTGGTPDTSTSQRPLTLRSQKRAREVHESDSDDELRFRFRRRR